MMPTEQLIAAQKSQLETIFALSNKAVEGLEQVLALNIGALKAAMQDASDATLAVLSTQDLQELSSLQPRLAQTVIEKLQAYSRRACEIASGTQAELVTAMEANAADVRERARSMVDSAARNAPAGTETALAIMTSAMSAANNAYDAVQQASKQAAEIVETRLTAMTSSALKPVQKSTPRKRSAAT